jgi:hypothetical protein
MALLNTINANGSTYSTPLTSEVFPVTAEVPLSPIYPSYGKFGNPCTVVGCCANLDVGEGALVQTTIYGASRTYIASHPNSYAAINNRKVLIRYD